MRIATRRIFDIIHLSPSQSFLAAGEPSVFCFLDNSCLEPRTRQNRMTFLPSTKERSCKILTSSFSFPNRFVNAQVYFGVSLGSVMLGGNIYLNFFLTSLVELPGNAFAIYAMNRLVVIIVISVLTSFCFRYFHSWTRVSPPMGRFYTGRGEVYRGLTLTPRSLAEL